MKISVEKLYQRAAERPPGYFEDCLAAGELRDDGYLYINASAYHSLKAKYSSSPPIQPFHHSTIQSAPPRSPNPQSTNQKRKMSGLGDAVALIAKPIARVIDRVGGTQLENCKPCARRQAKLNALMPFGHFPKP
jgi:hypothetical protein